jgi:hypothetical protein
VLQGCEEKSILLGSSLNRRNPTIDKVGPIRVSERIKVPRPESSIAKTSQGVIIKKVSIGQSIILGSYLNKSNPNIAKLGPIRVSERITVTRPESPIAQTSQGVTIKKVTIGGVVIIKKFRLQKDPPPEQFDETLHEVNIKTEAADDPLDISFDIKDEPLEEADFTEESIEAKEELERQVDRNILLFSASTKSSGYYLEFASDIIDKFLKFHKVSKVLFIPYA